MDRSRTTDEHSIRRIVAVLLALADLAESASGRSLAVRCLVLWLLRSAEVLACDHLAGLTGDAAGCQPVPPTCDSATDALRLAASFRDLAAALTAFAAESLASPQQGIAVRSRTALFGQPGPLAPLSVSTPAVGRRDSS